MRWAKHVANMEEGDVHTRFLVGKPGVKWSLWRPKCKLV